MGKLGCQNVETPESINIKFGVGDYAGSIMHPACQNSKRSPHWPGAFRQRGEI